MESGGDSVKKCFQCANCTAVCDLSTPDAPFPRKQMQLAGWGLKDKLAADPSVWYCHQCKDCSAHCPRNAKPADAIGAIRLTLIKHFAFPKFMGRLLNEQKYWPVVFLIPIIYLFAMLFVAGTRSFPTGDVHYAEFLPHIVLELMFSAIFFVGIAGAIIGGMKFWKGIDTASSGDQSNGQTLVPAIISSFIELFAHARFGKCKENSSLRIGHLLTFFGFAGLFIVTSAVVLFVILKFEYPFGFWHPLKVLGNLAGTSMIAGLAIIAMNRLKATDTAGSGSYPDWLFLIVLLGVGVTGFSTEALRFLNVPILAYPSYFIHMVFNFVLLVFLPYTKFAHIFYRFLALLHARMSGRDIGLGGISEKQEEQTQEVADPEKVAQEA